jgi:hypothetical protein
MAQRNGAKSWAGRVGPQAAAKIAGIADGSLSERVSQVAASVQRAVQLASNSNGPVRMWADGAARSVADVTKASAKLRLEAGSAGELAKALRDLEARLDVASRFAVLYPSLGALGTAERAVHLLAAMIERAASPSGRSCAEAPPGNERPGALLPVPVDPGRNA